MDTLIKIADFLDVSIDYLLDRTDNPLVNTSIKNNDNEIISIFNKLNKEQKEDVIKYAKIRKEM